MREILFRGKRIDNGKWVYGSLVQHFEAVSIIDEYNPFFITEVISETVGQFTGLTDKNGRKIFEGDIFKGYKIAGRSVNFVFWYDEDERAFMYGSVYKKGYRLSIAKYCMSIKESEMEIIGNIHDNPELMGGEENELDRRRPN